MPKNHADQELKITQLAAIARCYRAIRAAQASDPPDHLAMVEIFGDFAEQLDRIYPKRRERFAEMNLPTFVGAVASLVPELLAANAAQFAAFPAACDSLVESLNKAAAS